MLEGGNVSPFHEVAVWPFDVIIHQEVSHQALNFIDCEESTRAAEEVSRINRLVSPNALTMHACHDQREDSQGWL